MIQPLTNALQPELKATTTTAYRYYGNIYVLMGNRLFLVDNTTFSEWKPGDAVYAHLRKVFEGQKPIPYSEAVQVMEKLKSLVERLIG